MRGSRVTGLLAAAAIAVSAGACEWFNTMADPVDIQPHEREPIAPPEGSIPLHGLPAFTLADADTMLGPNPQPADSASVAIGAAYFHNFCEVCHGPTGLGNGPISDKFPAIPAIATDKVAGYSDQYIFALITQGRGLMPDYGRIPRTARWDVVRFVRTLRAQVAAADTTGTGGGQ